VAIGESGPTNASPSWGDKRRRTRRELGTFYSARCGHHPAHSLAGARTSPDTDSDLCDSTRGIADLLRECHHTGCHDPFVCTRNDGLPLLWVSNTNPARARAVLARLCSGRSRAATEAVADSWERTATRDGPAGAGGTMHACGFCKARALDAQRLLLDDFNGETRVA
jgi:hypothetical protein